MQDSQDAIAFKPKLLEFIRDEKILVLFKDKNLLKTLKILSMNKVPMTITEIGEAFTKLFSSGDSKSPDKKSEKTIYRYLNKLKEGGLVVPAGKRVAMKQGSDKIQTQTLYARKAKVFYLRWKESDDDECDKTEKTTKAMAILIGKHLALNPDSSSLECLGNLFEKIANKQEELLEKMVNEAGDEIVDLISDLDFIEIDSFLKKAQLLALLGEEDSWKEEIQNCFMEKKS